MTQYIRIEGRARQFGGAQAYFRRWCDQRAVRLYQRGYGFYLCRRCLHLAYESEREDAVDRAFRRLAKIKRRLGGDPDYFAVFPPAGRRGRGFQARRSLSQYGFGF